MWLLIAAYHKSENAFLILFRKEQRGSKTGLEGFSEFKGFDRISKHGKSCVCMPKCGERAHAAWHTNKTQCSFFFQKAVQSKCTQVGKRICKSLAELFENLKLVCGPVWF